MPADQRHRFCEIHQIQSNARLFFSSKKTTHRRRPAYAVARALQNLWILLERMQVPKSEPVTVEAIDITSAA
jgi:hypothetical protein